MSLTPGTKLGPYEIQAPLGAGGMGEVYKAKDTRLDRTVAIKVLPSHVASHPEVRQRFEREARAVSSLNHPHICTLHDIGSENGIDFMVMEHMEGETLAERLKKGALPLDQVLKYAAEIADALDKAHRQRVVHRDLKPGNIMLTPSGAKLLDFGLAKLAASGGSSEASVLSSLPTEQKSLTQKGAILGTFQYMAPEQLEGKDVDARTDIFAFGAVVYEMATGQKAFKGESQASLISAIMTSDPPPMSTVQPMSPPGLDHVIRTCLAKDPERRWQSASDLTRELEWTAGTASQVGVALPHVARRTISGRLAMGVVVGVVIVVLLGSIAIWNLMRPDPRPLRRFSVNLPAIDELILGPGPVVALSPDGKHLVYVGSHDDVDQLYLRPMDQLEATAIRGTEGALLPFFSPDGQWVGFSASDNKLTKVSLAGGAPIVICETDGFAPASWGSDGTIIFVSPQGLMQVSADGGTPEQLTTPDPDKGETEHRWPEILPGGDAFLFTAWFGSLDNASIAAQSLETGEQRILVAGTNPHYVPTGHIVFAQQGSLLAVPFDLDRLEVSGPRIPLIESLQVRLGGAAQFTVSREGTLVYLPGQVGQPEGTLVWVDRQGVARPLVDTPAQYWEPRVSPDGKRLAVSIGTDTGFDIWVLELGRGTLTRVTFGDGNDSVPIWTPDGNQITFSSNRSGGWDIFSVPADGSGEVVQLTTSEHFTTASAWSADGKLLTVQQQRPDTGLDIGVLRLEGEQKPELFLETRFNEFHPTFSPDGHRLAYTSDESGRTEVYVREFPGPGGKLQISTEGGSHPLWSHNGRELFYRSGNKMMVVSISMRPEFTPGVPVPLFEGPYSKAPIDVQETLLYDVAPDGQGFVMIQPIEDESGPMTQLNVVLNWFEELKRLAPTN